MTLPSMNLEKHLEVAQYLALALSAQNPEPTTEMLKLQGEIEELKAWIAQTAKTVESMQIGMADTKALISTLTKELNQATKNAIRIPLINASIVCQPHYATKGDLITRLRKQNPSEADLALVLGILSAHYASIATNVALGRYGNPYHRLEEIASASGSLERPEWALECEESIRKVKEFIGAQK